MADRMLMISWGEVVRGREELALESFNSGVGLYGRLQQNGRIESFDVCLLSPNATMSGFFALHGSAAQLAAVREDQEFQEEMTRASLIVDDLRITDGYTGDGVASQMQMWSAAIAAVPQMAT